MTIHTFVCGYLDENCYIVDVGQGRTVVIDPGADGKAIYDEAMRYGTSVDAILLTHGHFDHIGGLSVLHRLAGADVYVHSDDLPMLTDTRLNLSSDLAESEITAPVPVTALSGGEELTFGDTAFTVLHTPGHTPGCVCYVAGDVVFTGDTVFSIGYGRTDFPGSSFLQLRNSIRLLKNTIVGKTIYPGHGGTKIFT